MKQTQNALKFLLAQYRAIFKHAYVKGLATAAIVTAGLAMGQAQAAEPETFELYGFTGGIAKGNWGNQSLTADYVQLNKDNIGNTVNTLFHSDFAGLVKVPGWSADILKGVQSGGLTYYSGSTIAKEQNGISENATGLKHVNIIGKHNIDKETNTLLTEVSGAVLTLGSGGAIDLDLVRATSGAATTGGAIFAGFALNDGTAARTLNVHNNVLNVTGQRYADHAVVAGYVANSSGAAISNSNTMNYQSTVVKQSSESTADTYGANILAGFAQGTAGATADNNVMYLGTELAKDATVDISQKAFFGGGYAKTLDNDNVSAAEGTLSASHNTVEMSNFIYNTANRVKEENSFTYQNRTYIVGGWADLFGNDNSKPNYGTAVTASHNSVTLTNAQISTASDASQALLIHGGFARSDSTASGDTSITVDASNNALTIKGSVDRDGVYSTDISLLKTGDQITAGHAIQALEADNNVSTTANQNTLTVDTIKMTGGTLIAGHAVSISPKSGQDNKSTTVVTGNTLSVQGNTVLTNTSLLAAKVKGDSNGITHSGNAVSVAGNALAIADAEEVVIAGDTADVAGKVWVKGTAGSSVTFGGVLKEDSAPANNKYFNGTGTLTGTLYNQGGSVNVHNELDITKGTIYALGNNSIINVDGSKSAETDDTGAAATPDPLTAGYATLKTSEQQIKNYLTSGSATNVTLPKEKATDTETKIKESSAGVLAVTKGGAVDFGTSVTLSDFNFANSTTAGAIIVDAAGVSSGSSTFRADTVNVEHVLATNATTQTDIDKLTGVDASNVHLVANTLNLGTSSLTSEQSSKIAFADAKVKNEINFMVTSGKDGADGFVLADAMVKGDNYTITNSADSKNQYYTTDVLGNINGAVTISGSAAATKGELSIVNGDWQANDAITLAGSGALSVGGQSTDPSKLSDNNPSLPDATLKLTSALTIEDAASAATTVTVTGNTTSNQPYDYEHAQDTLGDDGLSFLDLTAGVNIVDTEGKVKDGSFAGKTTITAKNGGVILLNGSDVSAILAANNKTSDATSGAFFEANNGGALVFATDGGELQVGFGDFDATNHGIDIASNGYLAANTISVTELAPSTGEGSSGNPVDETGDWTRNFVDFGSNANVYVGDLTVSDLRASTAGNYVTETGIATGNVYIFNSLNTNNSTLHVGDPEDASSPAQNATLTFFTPYVSDTGSIAGMSTLQVNNGSELSFDNGTWDAAGTTINLASGSLIVGGNNFRDEDFAGIDVYTELNAQGLVVADGSTVKVSNDGTANFATADFSDLTAPAANQSGAVVIYGQMNIEDAASTVDGSNNTVYSLFGADGSIYIGKNGKLTFGSAATNHAIIADDQYKGSGSITAVFDANTDFGKIENQGGTLTLGLADSTTFDSEAIVALKHELFTENSFNSQGLLNNGGVLNIGFAHFEGFDVTPTTINGVDGYTATWEQLADFADVYSPDVTNESYLKTNVTNVGLGDNIIGHWGSLSLVPNVATSDAAKTQAQIAGDTTLNFAAGNGGFFVSDSTHSFALGAFVQAGKSLSLNNGGTIGYVTLETVSQELGDNAVDEAATILQVSGDGTTYITAIDTRGEYRRGTGVKILGTAEVAKDVSVGSLDAEGGSLLVKGNTLADYVEVEDNGSIDVAQKLTTSDVWVAAGSLKATDFVFDNNGSENNIDIIGGGKLTATTFVVNNANNAADTFISVGADSYDIDEVNTVLGTDYTGTGYFEVGTLTLNGAHLVVDPAYGQATAIASVNRFKQGNETYAYDTVTGTISGTVEIGQNAALGIGTASVDEVADVIALYQTNGSLSADKYGSILYLNGQTKLAEGSSIALNAKAQSADEISNSLLYAKTDANQNVTQQYADLGLGANTALILSERAFDNVAGDRAGVALTFARADAHVAGNGGEIVLVGTFDAAKPLNFFKDGDTNGVNIEGQDIVVRTQNGFLFTVLKAGTEAGYGEQLQVDKDQAYNIMYEASDPVIETLIAYHEGRIDPTLAGNQQQEQQPALEEQAGTEERAATTPDLVASGDTPALEQEQITTTTETTAVVGRSDFLNEVVTNSHGAPAEAAARLAIYGGTAQAALGASSTTTDAIAARLGVGRAGGLTIANNGQGAALWLAPVYKSHDSDGFDSQGLDYGVDLNLYGVALGADLEIMPGLTTGLMFNVGSGDVDGKGNTAANNTSNDFDYWGAALYGSYRYDALTVAADIGYTVVDNDLEANTGMAQYGKLESSADSTALTFGVTAKYAFDFNTVEVAPHAGLRYTNVDLDDYTVTSNGEDVAHFDAGSISVFSIPVGVTVAKEFVGDNWSVKPMFDLTLTGNFGDDEVDGTVSWTGVDNLTTGVSSEFLDNFTYGATLGVEAKTGSFSFGLGVNYTGSSNADEYGVNANARFVF